MAIELTARAAFESRRSDRSMLWLVQASAPWCIGRQAPQSRSVRLGGIRPDSVLGGTSPTSSPPGMWPTPRSAAPSADPSQSLHSAHLTACTVISRVARVPPGPPGPAPGQRHQDAPQDAAVPRASKLQSTCQSGTAFLRFHRRSPGQQCGRAAPQASTRPGAIGTGGHGQIRSVWWSVRW